MKMDKKSGLKSIMITFLLLCAAQLPGAGIFALCCSGELPDKKYILPAVIALAATYIIVTAAIYLTADKLKKKADARDRERRGFITSANHELKTPLTIMSADAQMLRSEIGENGWLDSIETQIKKLTEMTDGFTELARLEERKESEKNIFSLSDMSSDACGEYRAVAARKCIGFTTDIPENAECFGSEGDIFHLLSILLDNAFKYCPENGRVVFSLVHGRNSDTVSVSNDVARAYTEEELQHFFDRFYRADSACSGKGFGIGLSVAKVIAENHNGSITAAMNNENMLEIRVIIRATPHN